MKLNEILTNWNIEDNSIIKANDIRDQISISKEDQNKIYNVLCGLNTIFFYRGDRNCAEVIYATEDLGEGLQNNWKLFKKCPASILGKILKRVIDAFDYPDNWWETLEHWDKEHWKEFIDTIWNYWKDSDPLQEAAAIWENYEESFIDRELDKLKAGDFKDVDNGLKKEIYKLFQEKYVLYYMQSDYNIYTTFDFIIDAHDFIFNSPNDSSLEDIWSIDNVIKAINWNDYD